MVLAGWRQSHSSVRSVGWAVRLPRFGDRWATARSGAARYAGLGGVTVSSGCTNRGLMTWGHRAALR